MAKSILIQTLLPAYDVAGGDTTFDIEDANAVLLNFNKFDQVYLQVEYTGLDAADSELKLIRKAAASAEYSDAPGGVEILKQTVAAAADFDHASFGAQNLRLVFTAKTSIIGTISKIHIIAKSK